MGRYYYDPESGDYGTHYNVEDLVFGGMRSDKMDSLLVPRGYTVYLYDGHGFDG